MGLTIYTITAEEQWEDQVAIAQTVRDLYPELKVRESAEYGSMEMGWEWWELMQERVCDTIGKKNAVHTLACQAWQSGYLPFECELHELVIPKTGRMYRRPPSDYRFRNIRQEAVRNAVTDRPETLHPPWWSKLPRRRSDWAQFTAQVEADSIYQMASLNSLLRELAEAAEKLDVPVSQSDIVKWMELYDTDDACDNDPDLQCLAQTLLVGRIAAREDQPLWIVK